MWSSYVFLLFNYLKFRVLIWTIRQINYFNNSLFDSYSTLYFFLFYFCIEFFGTTEFNLILCVTLFQCFQEWVIRFIVNCIGSLLTVYASCTIFRFIFECQGIWVLYMDYANYVIWIHLRNWMRYKFLYLIFWIA